jgi:hypothetical protein
VELWLRSQSWQAQECSDPPPRGGGGGDPDQVACDGLGGGVQNPACRAAAGIP